MQFTKDGPENRVCSSHLHFRAWVYSLGSPSHHSLQPLLRQSGLSSLGYMLCKNGWAHQWEAGGSCKNLNITQPLLTCHAILLVKYSPGKSESQSDPIHLSHSLTVGPETVLRDTLSQVISWVCNPGTLPEDISNLKVLIRSFNCSETWMTIYCQAVWNKVADPPAHIGITLAYVCRPH